MFSLEVTIHITLIGWFTYDAFVSSSTSCTSPLRVKLVQSHVKHLFSFLVYDFPEAKVCTKPVKRTEEAYSVEIAFIVFTTYLLTSYELAYTWQIKCLIKYLENEQHFQVKRYRKNK